MYGSSAELSFSSLFELLFYPSPPGETGWRVLHQCGPAVVGVCAAGCSDADGDGQQRADTGHYFMSEICCFSVTVLQSLSDG